MKDIVDLPSEREFEVVSKGSNYFCDFKQSFLLRGKFSGFVFEFDILGFKPDLVAFLEWCELFGDSFGHGLLG